MQNLYIHDAIAPFFNPKRLAQRKEPVNWSKINFDLLEQDNAPYVIRSEFARIEKDFARYIRKVQEFGYNAVSLDDLIHLVQFRKLNIYRRDSSFYVRAAQYRKLYAKLFRIAKQHGMKIFLNTDLMFHNRPIDDFAGRLRPGNPKVMLVIRAAIEEALSAFRQIDGIIVRIGESEGIDRAHYAYQSRIIFKRPKQVNRLLKSLLPLFEKRQRLLVFRNWTVGIGAVGDLMNSRKTHRACFSGIESEHFILSMKYGESDFFRYMGLNRLFFCDNIRKIVEFQSRREYEGFGMYPSFIGTDVQQVLRKIVHHRNFAGIKTWGQTGGWGGGTSLLFLSGCHQWTAVNSYVIAALAKRPEQPLKDIIREYARQEFGLRQGPRQGLMQSDWLAELLIRSEDIIRKGLYISAIARKRMYFRGARIPTLLWVWWDTPVGSNLIFDIIYFSLARRGQVKDILDESKQALQSIDRNIALLRGKLQALGSKGNLMLESMLYQKQTFRVLHALRDIIFSSRTYFMKERTPHARAGLEKKIASLQNMIRIYTREHNSSMFPHYDMGESLVFLDRLRQRIRRDSVISTSIYRWYMQSVVPGLYLILRKRWARTIGKYCLLIAVATAFVIEAYLVLIVLIETYALYKLNKKRFLLLFLRINDRYHLLPFFVSDRAAGIEQHI